MAYETIKRNYQAGIVQDDLLASKRFVLDSKGDSIQFYEFEAAVVLDVVLDPSHPAFKEKIIVTDDWPKNIDGSNPKDDDPDYSWMGRIKFRFCNSQKGRDKNTLYWALPMENTGLTEYPLMNEVVAVAEYLGKFYYTKKLNIKSLINANADFSLERKLGLVPQNMNEYTGKEYTGPKSTMNAFGGSSYEGVLGEYFKFNDKIRTLKRYEGDTILESRFGSSVRFGSYDENRGNDNGVGQYADGGGNPHVLIRNGQAPIDPSNKDAYHHKGFVTESVNNDGSSVHLTSGKTVSEFQPTTKKVMFQQNKPEEQSNFSPAGATSFNYPKLDGDQIVINSDRLIFSSKANESFHFSKKRLSMVTDAEFTIDAHKQVVITTNELTAINSPKIYLGAYGDEDEPALLGRTSVYWLYQLCNWLILQTEVQISECEDWHSKHIHDKDSHGDTQVAPKSDWAKKMDSYASQLKTLRDQLIQLRDSLPTLMSNRVFVVGGGGAPGYDGGNLK